MRTVVGRVLDERLLGDPGLVEEIEHLAHVLVVVDHRVVIRGLPESRLPAAPLLGVREAVHVRGVQPHEPRLAGLLLALDEVLGGGDELVVAGLHPLPGERAGVLDLLLADLAPARLHRLVILVGGPRVDYPARPKGLAEIRELLFRRVVVHLRLLLGVEVVQVAEELVEAVIGRQHMVQVAEVVLAELPCGVPLLLEQRRDRHELVGHADRCAREADLREAGAVAALPGDERRPSRGARLFSVAVGEQHAFLRQTVDVRRPVPHQPLAVAAQVADPDVVSPDHQDVRLLIAFCHMPSRNRHSRDGKPLDHRALMPLNRDSATKCHGPRG